MSTSPTTGHRPSPTAVLALGALGVVYGDIGTSPLYTFAECLHHQHLSVTEPTVFGIVSLLFWSLTLVVTLKYVALLMNADNKGEGGIMALLTLLPAPFRSAPGGRVGLVSLLVIAGAALLFGDGVITPAISVLSAMEGLGQANEALKPYVVPSTVGILLALFLIQKRGTGSLGVLFGPIMLAWFGTLAVLGIRSSLAYPSIWAALSPKYALDYFVEHGLPGAAILGSVVLAVTGGEALYADMGHFGRRPIRVAWLFVVYPALVLSYLGQGALILSRPEAAEAPFFAQVPTGAWTYALVGLSAAATVIASQSLISAVFSLTHQALRLGYLPRVATRHTSSEMEGQIYVPLANWILAASCIALVLAFGASSKLAAAYGLAVSGTMGITSIVFWYVTVHVWKWPRLRATALLAVLLALDIPFFAATCLKFFEGGYLPFALGAGLFVLMSTWFAGRALLGEHLLASSGDLEKFIDSVRGHVAPRLPGLLVVMTATGSRTPPVLTHLVRRFHAVHEHVFLLTVTTESAPYIEAAERLTVEPLREGFYRVIVRYGYMEEPVVPSAVLHAIKEAGLHEKLAQVVYLLGRESFMATDRGKMSAWREEIFAFLNRNAMDPTLYFRLPAPHVVELGSRVEL